MATQPEPEETQQGVMREVVEALRRLTPPQRRQILDLAQRMATEPHAPTITDSDGETIVLDDDYFRRQDEERRARLAAPPLSDDDLAAMRAAHPEQAWFWTREWYDGEREIDEQRAAGIRGTIYNGDDEFQAALDRIPPADADL